MNFFKKLGLGLGLGLLALSATQGAQAAKYHVIFETEKGESQAQIMGAHGPVNALNTSEGQTEFSVTLEDQWIEAKTQKAIDDVNNLPNHATEGKNTDDMSADLFINALRGKEDFSATVTPQLNTFIENHIFLPEPGHFKAGLNLDLPGSNLGVNIPENHMLDQFQIEGVFNNSNGKSMMKSFHEYASQEMYVSFADRPSVLERLASQAAKDITESVKHRIFETVYTAFSNAMFCLGIEGAEDEEFKNTALKDLFTVKVKLIDQEEA